MCIGSNIHNVNVDQPCNLDSTSITYLEAQLAKSNFWNSYSNLISIFGTIETILDNLKNIKVSLYYIINFIKN